MKHGQNGGGSRRQYKIKGLTTVAADDAEFDNDQAGSRMTVAAYFKQAYGMECVLSVTVSLPISMPIVCLLVLTI